MPCFYGATHWICRSGEEMVCWLKWIEASTPVESEFQLMKLEQFQHNNLAHIVCGQRVDHE